MMFGWDCVFLLAFAALGWTGAWVNATGNQAKNDVAPYVGITWAIVVFLALANILFPHHLMDFWFQ